MDPDAIGEEAVPASTLSARVVFALVKFGGVLGALLIILVLGIIVYAIFQRYVMNSPLLWGDELIGYIMVAIVMLGAAEALRNNDHISIDLLTARAGPKLCRLLLIWSDLAVLAFVAVFGWSTWGSIRFGYDFGSYSVGYIEIATWIPQVPMLIGAVLLGLAAITRILENIARGPSR